MQKQRKMEQKDKKKQQSQYKGGWKVLVECTCRMYLYNVLV